MTGPHTLSIHTHTYIYNRYDLFVWAPLHIPVIVICRVASPFSQILYDCLLYSAYILLSTTAPSLICFCMLVLKRKFALKSRVYSGNNILTAYKDTRLGRYEFLNINIRIHMYLEGCIYICWNILCTYK